MIVSQEFVIVSQEFVQPQKCFSSHSAPLCLFIWCVGLYKVFDYTFTVIIDLQCHKRMFKPATLEERVWNHFIMRHCECEIVFLFISTTTQTVRRWVRVAEKHPSKSRWLTQCWMPPKFSLTRPNTSSHMSCPSTIVFVDSQSSISNVFCWTGILNWGI